MDTSNTLAQTDVNQVYYHASDLLYNQKLTAEEAKNALVIEKGVTENVAQAVIDTLERQIKAKKDAAQKDMVYGALWCVGGTVATLAHIGFIFWGAIVFGGIQFFRGLANSQ